MKNPYLIFMPLLMMIFISSCNKGDTVFTRENDALSCDCTEQDIEQNILCDGSWSADLNGSDWISVDPESGTGNGKDYSSFTVKVAYNPGAEREDTIYLAHSGKRYPIAVKQEKCAFGYGTPEMSGNLFLNIKSEATIEIPYTLASGKESVSVSAKITGAGNGLSLGIDTYDEFSKGNGTIEIPINGTPEMTGTVYFEIYINGSAIGTLSKKILRSPDSMPVGIPVGWNFYATEITPKGSDYDFGWSQSSKNPSSTITPYDTHRVLPTSGNTSAYLTAYSSTVSSLSNYTFNPSIQIRGMVLNDYWLAVIPVKNICATDSLIVEAAFGAAGSGASYYVLEFSDDNDNWHTAEGAVTMNIFGGSGPVHYYVPAENTGTERKTYDKNTDKGYKKYTFPLSGITTIDDGILYIRLRISINQRANASETTYAIASNSWADLKGLEIHIN